MKNEKGITLIMLISTIIVLVIIATVTIQYGSHSVDSIALENFSFELQQIQGKVDTIHEKIKLGETEYLTYGQNITVSEEAVKTLNTVTGINYKNIPSSQRDKYYSGTNTKYRYFSSKDISEYFDISSNPGDVIINFETREVISVKGFGYKGKIYYKM